MGGLGIAGKTVAGLAIGGKSVAGIAIGGKSFSFAAAPAPDYSQRGTLTKGSTSMTFNGLAAVPSSLMANNFPGDIALWSWENDGEVTINFSGINRRMDPEMERAGIITVTLDGGQSATLTGTGGDTSDPYTWPIESPAGSRRALFTNAVDGEGITVTMSLPEPLPNGQFQLTIGRLLFGSNHRFYGWGGGIGTARGGGLSPLTFDTPDGTTRTMQEFYSRLGSVTAHVIKFTGATAANVPDRIVLTDGDDTQTWSGTPTLNTGNQEWTYPTVTGVEIIAKEPYVANRTITAQFEWD